MSVWPAAGTTGAELLVLLRETSTAAMNLLGGGTHDPVGVVDRYLQWVSDSAARLRLQVLTADLDRLITTPRYWATCANPTPSKAALSAVVDEILARQRDLLVEVAALQSQVDSWAPDVASGRTSFVVPDTNVLLGTASWDTLDWHDVSGTRPMTDVRLVLPMMVIDEIDNLKDHAPKSEQRTRAREALKAIYSVLGSDVEGRHIVQSRRALAGQVSVQLLQDPRGHTRLPIADDELVDRALSVASFTGHQLTFVTYDTGAALRAAAVGLLARRLDGRPSAKE